MAYDPNATLPDSQDGTLQAILDQLIILVARTAIPDQSSRTRVTVDAPLSENVAQVNGITVLTGAGASGTGTQRVTPANDTVACINSTYLVQQGWNNAPLPVLYSNIATS